MSEKAFFFETTSLFGPDVPVMADAPKRADITRVKDGYRFCLNNKEFVTDSIDKAFEKIKKHLEKGK